MNKCLAPTRQPFVAQLETPCAPARSQAAPIVLLQANRCRRGRKARSAAVCPASFGAGARRHLAKCPRIIVIQPGKLGTQMHP
jgi:hypothetical protein